MGSATRSALEAARSALAATKGVDLTTGEQLLAASRTIGTSTQLQSALTDPSASPEDKGALLSALFGSLSPAALALLTAMAQQRWSTAEEFLAGLEEIGIRAVASSTSADAGLEAELFTFGAAVASDAELELALGSKRGSAEGKRSLVESLLAGSASAQAVAIAGHLVQQPRGRRIGELVRTGAAIVADSFGKGIATVSVARPLSDEQRASVGAMLRERYGRDHTLNQVIDPALVGGVRVQVGDDVIDGSVAARLAELTLRLAG